MDETLGDRYMLPGYLGHSISTSFFIYTFVLPKKKEEEIQKNEDLIVLRFHIVEVEFAILL